MKKLVTLVCMIACILGLTACGSDEVLNDHVQDNVAQAQQIAPTMVAILETNADAETREQLSEYTYEELTYMLSSAYQMEVDGYAFSTGLESFSSALDEIGAIVSTDEPTVTVNGDQILVHVGVTGETGKSAEAELIYTNDMFLRLESAALNPKATMSELMKRAGLNTLIGMSTVFGVLILISLIIACFGVIPKIQAKLSKKPEQPVEQKAQAPIVESPVQEAGENLTDDLELVAVIAAAIAATEGQATTDGFVVRSIRRR